MADRTAPRVVVGIDATSASATGVRFAALEAQRLGAELDIVHATPGYSEIHGDIPIIGDNTLSSYGHELLDDAEAIARSVAPNLRLRAHLLSGDAVSTLVSSAEGAQMLVLGGERRSLVGRIWTGDIVGGAAASSHCPVVVVGPEWEPGEEHGRIVVGLKSTNDATELLAAGLALAHECKAELVVVHAWKLQSGYDDIVANRVAADEYGRRMTTLIEPMINDLRNAHPEVAVRIEVLHAQPAYALVDASANADRLLLSRPSHANTLHHLGPVARAVLHEARCPVEVLPPPGTQLQTMQRRRTRAFVMTNEVWNRILIPLLRSPAGRVLGRRLAVLEYQGRRSEGTTSSSPVTAATLVPSGSGLARRTARRGGATLRLLKRYACDSPAKTTRDRRTSRVRGNRSASSWTSPRNDADVPHQSRSTSVGGAARGQYRLTLGSRDPCSPPTCPARQWWPTGHCGTTDPCLYTAPGTSTCTCWTTMTSSAKDYETCWRPRGTST